jgi:hydroxyacylglutathione hydrolase
MKTWHTSKGTMIQRLQGGGSHSFLIRTGNHTFLVDTGRRIMLKMLLKQMHNAGVRQIDYLILTHTHFDHAENAVSLKERFGSRIIVHESEAALLKKGENPLVAGTIAPTRFLARLFARTQTRFRYRAVEPDILMGREFDLTPLGISGHILHTPGHTQGSVSVIIENEIALAGDTLFGMFPGSIFPPFGQNVPQIIESWGLLAGTGCRVFLPAHGGERSLDLLSQQHRKHTGRITDPWSENVDAKLSKPDDIHG